MKRVSFLILFAAAVGLLCTASWGQVVVHEIPAPSATAVGLCWDGSALWVSDQTATIYKINPANGAVLRTLTGPVVGSRGLAYADGYLWTISRAASDFHTYKIDTTSGAIVSQTIDPTNGYAGGLAWDGAALWFSVFFPTSGLLKIDPMTGDTLAQYPSPGVRPYGLAYDGTSLWNTSEDTGMDRVYRFSAVDGHALWSFDLPPHSPQPGRRPRGAAWDGQHLWLIAYEPTSFNVKIYQYDVGNAVNPDIVVNGDGHDFGGRVLGSPSTWSFSISNIGNVGLVLDSIGFTTGEAFVLDAPTVFPRTVAADGMDTITVRFNPPHTGLFNDSLILYSNDPDEGRVTVFLTGLAWANEGDIDPQPVAVDFGAVRISSPLLSTSRIVQVYNSGHGLLHITSVQLIGDTTFRYEPVPVPVTVDSMGYYPVRIWFNPRQVINYSAMLRLQSDDPDEPVVDVQLFGSGDNTPLEGGEVMWYFETPADTWDHSINSVTSMSDVDGDGIADVAMASDNGLVYCLNGSSTNLADTFWTFEMTPTSSGAIYKERGMCRSPDLTGDGIDEIVVGTTGISRSVIAISGATGEQLWSFDTHLWGGGGWVYEVSPVGDLDGDQVSDIIAAAGDDGSNTGPRRVFALSGASGQLIWSSAPIATFYSVRAIQDVTGDFRPDVVAGGTNGLVYCYNGFDGTPLWSQSVTAGSPAFALLPMGNANPEATITEDVIISSAYYGIYCLDGGNGAIIWQQPVQTYVYFSIGIGSDLTGDAVHEVYWGTTDGMLFCADGSSGQILWNLVADPFAAENVLCLTTVPDLTGDGIMDIACGTLGDNIVLLDGWDGDRIWHTSGNGPSSPVDCITILPDIDHNNSWEIVVGHRDGLVEALSGGLLVDAANEPVGIVREMSLGNAYPNPFNAVVTVPYSLDREGLVRISVYDILGRHTTTILDAVQTAGSHSVVWSGTKDRGGAAASGIYFVRMQAGSFSQTRKIVLMK